MKRLLLACCMLLCAWAAHADSTLTKHVDAFVDRWHDDAAHSRPVYFDKIARDGIYIGTDKGERWRRDEFKAWAQPHFKRKSAWVLKPMRRHVYASEDGAIVWFDELLDTRMGICQASGVLRRKGDSFEIVHYQLSMAVPNEVGSQVTKLIRDFEEKDGWKGGPR
ncbi:nuclear transport factor 2 family protein [Massilia sp. Dwa41.01b]|uniref:nuclear transport factor 2 family protein n=1 Tax=unclassified Massilia TaxID=2609279 RepID=UPI0016039A51|nr:MULTISPECIES: nuclear transport factor 2 family protein [unclassified Massilia]QNA89832.1 nuclear transport factor 2 family protein [Massilia sp. Dwa41.01b]QNB00724.1 nuclear transport factor 2 family protein [Massilia sp. Se16.2.3]